MVYSRGDSIAYQKSWTDGYSWTKDIGIGVGNYPCLAKDSKGGLCAAWLDGNIRYARKTSPWIPGFSLPVMNASAPAMTLGKGDTVFLAFIQYNWLPQDVGTLICLRFPSDKFDSAHVTVDTLYNASGSPTITVDSKNSVHIAWRYNDDIYWTQRNANGTWKAAANISYSSGVVSQNPSLAYYGDVHLVWQEGNDIYHNKGNWSLQLAVKAKIIVKQFSWQGAENVSNNPGTASVNPVFDGNYVAWSEVMSSGDTEAYMSLYKDFVWQPAKNYSNNPTQPSAYPQIAYRQNVDGNKMTTVWTEGTGPLYSLIARDSAGAVTPKLAADVGGTEPSIYTIERDGYLVYGQTKSKTSVITVDYDSTALEYYLPTLDREQKQTLKMSLYQEYADKADHVYQVWVDQVSLGAVKVPSSW
ncbi:hypothetical protein HY768_05515 [candidate division TA06 bacterium]|uniref:Uncharacterized protein n=1 Tax=candidate division TA06 bacterium TaxID=2250710 RepID=A0A933I8Q9_UNCT6|nr:hypothetical protein [candidate division TA06 bacterium]